MRQQPQWQEMGKVTLPQMEPGETPLNGWVVDQAPYVLFAFLVSFGEIHRLRMYGYEPGGAQDAWTAESNASRESLQDLISQELQRLATGWGGRLRSVKLEGVIDWAQELQNSLADGVVQVISKPPESENPEDAAA